MTQTAAWPSIRHPGIAHVVNDPRFDEDEKLLDTSFPAFFRMDEMVVSRSRRASSSCRDKQPKDVKIYAVARTTPQPRRRRRRTRST